MKYLQALAEKNLNFKDLSKKIKEKIQAIEKVQKDWAEKTEPTEEEQELYAYYLETLDSDIAKLIKKFNLEAHQKKIQRMSELGKARKKSDVSEEVSEEVKEEKEEVNPLDEENSEEAVEQKNPLEEDENSEEENYITQKLEELKKSVEIDTERFKEEAEEKPEPEFVEAEEIEDFKKTKTVRPKSQSVGIIIAVAGGFLLCWGLLMFAHSKRQNG